MAIRILTRVVVHLEWLLSAQAFLELACRFRNVDPIRLIGMGALLAGVGDSLLLLSPLEVRHAL